MSHDETKRGNFPARHTLSKKPVLTGLFFNPNKKNWQRLRNITIEYLFRRFTGTYKREKATDTHKKKTGRWKARRRNQPRKKKPSEKT